MNNYAIYKTDNLLLKGLIWKLEEGHLNYWGKKKFLSLIKKWDSLYFWGDKIYDDMSMEDYRGDWEKRMYNELKEYLKYDGLWK